MAKPKVDYVFDATKNLTMYSWYFALEAQKIYGGKILCLLTDSINKINKPMDLFYCCLEIYDGLYMDPYGIYTDFLSHRPEVFKEKMFYDDSSFCIVKLSVDETYALLDKLGLKYSDVEKKKNCREFLRNNLYVCRVQYFDAIYLVGLCGREIDKFDYVLVMGIDRQMTKFDNYMSKFYTKLYKEGFRDRLGWEENTNWYYKKK